MSKSNQIYVIFFFVYECKSRLLLIVYYILNIWYTIFNSIRKIICDLDYTQMCYTSIPRWNNKVEQLHIMHSALEFSIHSIRDQMNCSNHIFQKRHNSLLIDSFVFNWFQKYFFTFYEKLKKWRLLFKRKKKRLCIESQFF